jgi:hypothetical protein
MNGAPEFKRNLALARISGAFGMATIRADDLPSPPAQIFQMRVAAVVPDTDPRLPRQKTLTQVASIHEDNITMKAALFFFPHVQYNF